MRLTPGDDKRDLNTDQHLVQDGLPQVVFHYMQGVAFDFNAGAYSNLNMWKQVNNRD